MKKALSMVLALMMLLTMCVVPVMAEEPEGSASNPYYVANPMTAPGFITIPANSAVYYQYKSAVFSGWEVAGYGLSAIIVDGVVYDTPDMWGEICAPLNFTFVSPGIVAYVNDTAEDIEVMISHNEPIGTENNPADLADGDNTFSIPANIMNYVAVYMPLSSGEYTFSTEQAEDFIVTVDVDGNAVTMEDGSLTLTLESYIPVVVTMTAVGMTGDITLTVTAPTAGTADNPIWLDESVMDQDYPLEGTDSLYFNVDGALAGSTLIIESVTGTDLTVLLDGVKFIAVGGSLCLPLESGSWYMEMVISQAEDASNALYFSIAYYEGHENNPIGVVDGDNAISIPAGSDSYYYEYVVEKDGLLVVTPADVNAISGLFVYTPDYESSAAMNIENGDTCVQMPVTAGDTIVMQVYPVYDEETWESLAVDTVLNIVVKDMPLYSDFENGDVDGWSSASIIAAVDGEMDWYDLQFDVTENWGNIYRNINVEANTDYVVSFEMKSNYTDSLFAKFLLGDWSATISQADVAATEEWTDYEVTLNSGDNTTVVLLLQSNVEASKGQTFWLDNIIVTKVESEEPGDEPVDGDNLVVNGGFETGDNTGWEILQSTEISADAANNGGYGAHLIGNGGWGGMLNQTIAVEAGKEYKLNFWLKVNANGVNIQAKQDSWQGANIEGTSGWFDANAAKDWTLVEWTFTAPSDVVYINFCGSGNGNTEDIYVDDVQLIAIEELPVVPPVEGNLVVNGNFETGDNTGWDIWQSTEIGAEAAHTGGYGAHLIGDGGWGGMLNQTIAVEAGKEYKLNFWLKVNANGVNIQAKQDSWQGANIEGTSGWFDANAAKDWTLVEWTFTAPSNVVYINFCGGGNGNAEDIYVDDVQLVAIEELPVVPPVEDNLVVNGDFEAGNTDNWIQWYPNGVEFSVVEGGYNSDYAVEINGISAWHNMRQQIAVNPNSVYEVSAWVKKSENFDNCNFKLMTKNESDTADIDGVMVQLDNDEWQKVTFTFESGENNAVYLQMMAFEDGVGIIVDNITMVKVSGEEPAEPSFDGYITNGDFECGTLSGWDKYVYDWYTTTSKITNEVVFEGEYALALEGRDSHIGLYQVIEVEADSDYVFKLWYKSTDPNGSTYWVRFKNSVTGEEYAVETLSSSTSEWTEVVIDLYTWDATSVCVEFVGYYGASYEGVYNLYVDSISMEKVGEEIVYGDANGDGKVNNRDLGLLQQCLNGYEVELDRDACDVNGDGKVNNRDLGLLQQYLNGYEVELG